MSKIIMIGCHGRFPRQSAALAAGQQVNDIFSARCPLSRSEDFGQARSGVEWLARHFEVAVARLARQAMPAN